MDERPARDSYFDVLDRVFPLTPEERERYDSPEEIVGNAGKLSYESDRPFILSAQARGALLADSVEADEISTLAL